MSALPPIADICSALACVVPIADIAHLRIEASIFLMLDDVGTDPKTGRCRLARGSHCYADSRYGSKASIETWTVGSERTFAVQAAADIGQLSHNSPQAAAAS